MATFAYLICRKKS